MLHVLPAACEKAVVVRKMPRNGTKGSLFSSFFAISCLYADQLLSSCITAVSASNFLMEKRKKKIIIIIFLNRQY